MPVGRDPLDRRLLDVHQPDVGLVVDLVVPRLQRHAAGAEAVVLRDQLLRDLRVLHPLADLAGDEVAEIASFASRSVSMSRKLPCQMPKPRLGVELLEEASRSSARHLEGAARIGRVEEAGEGLAGSA